MPSVLSRGLILLWAACCLAAAATGQEAGEPLPKLNLKELGIGGFGGVGEANPASISASFQIEKGSRRGTLSVSALIDDSWHVFSITQPKGGPQPSKIAVAKTAPVRLLGSFQPDREPHTVPPAEFPVPSEQHAEAVTWSAPIELTGTEAPESVEIAVDYHGQVCRDGPNGACIPLDEKFVAKFAGFTEPPQFVGTYQPDPKQAELTLEGHVEPAAVQPGGKVQLVITARPSPGWHVYAYEPIDSDAIGANKPTLIVPVLPPGWRRSPVAVSAEPTVKPAKDGLPAARYHEEPVTWTTTLTVPKSAAAGEAVLSGYLGLQTCKESCLPPFAVQFRANIPVAKTERPGKIPLEFIPLKKPAARSGDAPAAGAVYNYPGVAKLAKASPAPTGRVDWAGLMPVVGFGLLGGLILNLMPCVLPVIGLKVLSFAQQGGQSRSKVFALNVWFAAGLLLVFLVLATLAAFGSYLLGENLAWGQQFTYTPFKVAMVVVVFAFALSFLGVWEVPIPGFAQTSASGKLQQQEGPAGAFFKGIFTTLLATPCSGPFLGPVFAYTLTQPPLATYILFASVGLGMASPYLVIGAFPHLVRWLPKPGPWMDTLKQIMGFVLLGTVVYLFATINHDYFIPTLALMMGVWFACWIIGQVPVYEETRKQVFAWAGGVAAAAAIGWAAFTYLGPVQHLYEWQPYTPEQIAGLQREGKTVMVDFTADWCLTCQWNFRRAINTIGVREVVERNDVLPMLADWTDESETIRTRLAELNSQSIPLLAVYPADKPGEVIVLRDVITEKQLIKALEEAGPSKEADSAAAATAEVEQPAVSAL